MPVIKCKACTADLHLIPGKSIAVCEYCGVEQTVPNSDNEKKLSLFARAHRLRAACDFDKAAAIYETIVAEFADEAEAYWGLVLCKYGIEYVDDPKTGHKIPTCHRSSFDSVLNDPNYQQTLACCDDVAAKVYQREAQELETIRRQILELSGKSENYDIFICYKETDPATGERTPDSLLADDIYQALTREGYKVFFSRVTMDEHLGENYEPYIFAALNSAKIMLAVGTSAANYQSVWVKNEWSRYLKLMAAGQQKTLISCFKDIQPEDIPQEFRHVHGMNFNKLGALQDLVQGVKKILPLQAQVNTSNGADTLTPLLQRGAMALEDQEWIKANSFYEKALNTNAQCAEAYLGKFLFHNKARSLDELLRIRQENFPAVQAKKVIVPLDTAPAKALSRKYSIYEYLIPDTIETLLQFDASFTSTLEDWMAILQTQEQWLKDNKNWARAKQYASPALKQQLDHFESALLVPLAQTIKDLCDHDERMTQEIAAKYEAHLADCEKKLINMHSLAESRRRGDYDSLCRQQDQASTVEQFTELSVLFSRLRDYEDAPQRAQLCKERSIQIKNEQYQKALQASTAKKEAARRAAKRKILKSLLMKVLVIVAIVGVILYFTLLAPYLKKQAILADAPTQYAMALQSNDTVKTALTLGKLGMAGFDDAAEKSREYWAMIAPPTTFTSYQENLMVIQQDGTILADTEEDIDLTQWTDIVSVTSGIDFVVGLKSDGTVVTHNLFVSNRWKDIVAITSGRFFAAGLKADGTVVVAGSFFTTIKLSTRDWTNIIAIAAYDDHLVGLKADGTVVATGTNDYHELDVSDWTDIVQIATGGLQTVGVKSDGTVVVACDDSLLWNQREAEDWENIVHVACTNNAILGIHSDGTIVIAGDNPDFNHTPEYTSALGWYDITAVKGFYYQFLGLQSDGTLLTTDDEPLAIYNVKQP